MSSVTFESGSALETIGDYAFLGTAIESITIPSTVTSIGSGAFRDCSSLKTVDFEATAKINTIKSLTFYNSGITSIIIPDSVTEIEYSAFHSCSSLSYIQLGSNITSIVLTD